MTTVTDDNRGAPEHEQLGFGEHAAGTSPVAETGNGDGAAPPTRATHRKAPAKAAAAKKAARPGAAAAPRPAAKRRTAGGDSDAGGREAEGEPQAGTPTQPQPQAGTPTQPRPRAEAATEPEPRAEADQGRVPGAALAVPMSMALALPEPPAPPAPAPVDWSGRAVAAAAALAATDVLLLVGVLVTGLVASTTQGPVGARLGTAFVDGVGTAHGLLLVVAAGLLAWAARAGSPLGKRVAKVVLGLAVVFFIASPLAALGNVAYLHHSRQVVDGVVRTQLATWMAVTMVPEGVAAMVAWWVVAKPRQRAVWSMEAPPA